MPLIKTIGSALDGAIAGNPGCEGFVTLKAASPEVRRYFREDAFSQCQILFYRDKFWTKEGGSLYGEVFCLIPAVQQALCGKSQSLAMPDYSIPFHHFQYGLLEHNPERCWQIHGEADVPGFAAAIDLWLARAALPWLAQFDSIEAVIAFMQRHGRFVDLALLCAAQGAPASSALHLVAWINQLPRQIEKPLARLLEAGLLSQDDHRLLSRASIQREDHYREQIDAWIATIAGQSTENARSAEA